VTVLLPLSLLVPLATAVAAFLLRRRAGAERAVSLTGALILVGVTARLFVAVWADGPLATQMGGWAAPFGITLVADMLSAALAALGGALALLALVYACAEPRKADESHGLHALLHVMLAGVQGAFLTGDLFNLYVWFEVLLISSFAVLVVGQDRRRTDAGVKYLVPNMLGTVFFLTGVALVYARTGTLNFADLHAAVQGLPPGESIDVGVVFLLLAFILKAGIFPLFAWLPASYHTPPVAVSALFAALLTKVGVYGVARLLVLVVPTGLGPLRDGLLGLAALTMVVGVLGALVQRDMRRLLNFTVVSHIGFAVFGLALKSQVGVMAALFYMLQDMMVKTGLFLACGMVQRESGGETRMRRLGGLWSAKPALALLFLPSALALAGIPPFVGFWGKLMLVQAGVAAGAWAATAVMLLATAVNVLVVGRLFAQAFWAPAPPDRPPPLPLGPGGAALLLGPVLVLAAAVTVAGVVVEPGVQVAGRAAAGLLDPAAYLAAVRGEGNPG